MGSGSFASAGWTHAAYQRTISYIDIALTSHGTNCSANQTDSSCYTIAVHNNISSSWATYVFFGGPKCPNPSKSGAVESSRSSPLRRGWQHGRWRERVAHLCRESLATSKRGISLSPKHWMDASMTSMPPTAERQTGGSSGQLRDTGRLYVEFQAFDFGDADRVAFGHRRGGDGAPEFAVYADQAFGSGG